MEGYDVCVREKVFELWFLEKVIGPNSTTVPYENPHVHQRS